MPTVNRPRNVDLSSLTTLRVGGRVELWEVESEADLREATTQPFRVLGAGSNILANDAGLSERVVRLGRSFNTLADWRGRVEAWVGASTPLPGLVRRTQQAGLSGLEGLLGVPAVVGGAVAMNAGTRFGSMADTLQEVELFVDGRLERLPAEALDLGYRSASLPASSVITGALLRFSRSTPERVDATLKRVDEARKGQPKIKSAGCAFRNPSDDSAGRLIDRAGLKGLRVGDAMVSFEHGNFIVNMGDARAHDVLSLVREIQSRVGRELELEWKLWGF